MTDPRLSSNGPTRWAAVDLTKTRCRHCYADIVQLRPDDRWRDVESEAATCTVGIYHQPLRSQDARSAPEGSPDGE